MKSDSRKVKTQTLLLGLTVGFVYSLIVGYTAGAMGFGSRYPTLNLIAKPLVCPNQRMSYQRHASKIGTTTYWTATWFCEDTHSGARTELSSDTVFLYAGIFYGLSFFGLLLAIVYLYWNSSVGPAKNDGLRLW